MRIVSLLVCGFAGGLWLSKGLRTALDVGAGDMSVVYIATGLAMFLLAVRREPA